MKNDVKTFELTQPAPKFLLVPIRITRTLAHKSIIKVRATYCFRIFLRFAFVTEKKEEEAKGATRSSPSTA